MLGAVAVAIALTGVAGAGIGPVPGNSLGNSHGLRYERGSYDPFVQGNIVVLTPCQEGVIAPWGGGVDVTGPPKKSYISSSNITKGHWYGEDENRVSAARTIRVFAICPRDDMAPVSFPFEGTSVSAGETGAVEATCASGSLPVGGGIEMRFGIARRSEPFDDDDANKTPDGWRVKGVNTQKGNEDLTAGIACLNIPRQDVRYVTKSTKVDAGKVTTITARCPSSMSVSSGGFSVGGQESFVHSAIPKDLKSDGNDVPDDAFAVTVDNRGDGKVKARASAICVDA